MEEREERERERERAEREGSKADWACSGPRWADAGGQRMLALQLPAQPVSAAEFAARLRDVAEGIRATQRQRNTQRRAAKLQASQVCAELLMLREDLNSLKTLLRRCGTELFHEVAEGLGGVAALATAEGQQAAEQAASASFSVFLCSQKHTARELAACASAINEHGLRAGLAEVKVRAPLVCGNVRCRAGYQPARQADRPQAAR